MTNILVVDDRSEVREVVTMILKNENYFIFEAESGMEAFKMACDNPIDLIVTDYEMPNGTGKWLINEVQEHLSRELPIVLLSGKEDLDAKEAQGFGAWAYLHKRDLQQLPMVVKKYLNRT